MVIRYNLEREKKSFTTKQCVWKQDTQDTAGVTGPSGVIYLRFLGALWIQIQRSSPGGAFADFAHFCFSLSMAENCNVYLPAEQKKETPAWV